MRSVPKRHFTFVAPLPLAEAVDDIAYRRRVPVSVLIREALECLVSRDDHSSPGDTGCQGGSSPAGAVLRVVSGGVSGEQE